MEIASNSELKGRQLKLRHMFLPDAYGFVSEVVIAILALIVFNATLLSDQLLVKGTGTSDPLETWPQIAAHVVDGIGHYYVAQQIILFAMWAVIGALVYILIFRLLQMGLGVSHSVGQGVRYVKQDHQRGLFRWLGSLHDFFIKLLIVSMGATAIAIGSLICFGIASQELNNGLMEPFPSNLGSLAFSIVAAILSVRIIVFGVSLLSPRFQRWYTA